MLHRRQVLLSGAAVAAASAFSMPFAAAAESASDTSKKLNALFDSFVSENLDLYPEGATQLGLDTGVRAHQRAEVSDRSLKGIEKGNALAADQLRRLDAFDRADLNKSDQLSYDVVRYGLAIGVAASNKYPYAGGGLQGPYVISQLSGVYQSGPDFLDSAHPVQTKPDADAYLARLNGFAALLDDDTDVAKHDAGLGVTPPDFVLARTLEQMTKFRSQKAEESVLVESLARRAKEKNIPGDWAKDATRIVNEKVYPALDRQIAFLKSLQPNATHDAGVWRLPQGLDYYADSMHQATTSDMTPDAVHKLGLDLVAELSSHADAIMKANGMTKGTVGERMRAMYLDPKFRYENTDAGKEKLIADLNVKVTEVRARLPKWFGQLPKADVVIKRVPKYTEAGAPGGYYNPPSLDGTRPGIYYINLRDTAEVPSWTLPTLTFHEAIPGHHLQNAIQQEADLPLIRRLSFFNAYIEGWALYSEELAVEMGEYDNDPWGHVGQLHDAMFRAVRLVVDSGIHAMKWSRERAVKYYTDTIGDPESGAITEIERYCVEPGQASSYMIGKMTFLSTREDAKKALGSKFDIRQFHDAVLQPGALPLSVLKNVVGDYIAAHKA